MSGISSSILLGSSTLETRYKITFYNENEKVVAQVYDTDKKIGECVLNGLSPFFPWTYDKLSITCKSQIQLVVKKYNDKSDGIKRKAEEAFPKDEDSDEELNGQDVETVFIFKQNTPIPANTMTVPCSDYNIKGSALIEITHQVIQSRYEEMINLCCEYEKDIDGPLLSLPLEENGILIIDQPTDWFLSLGGWKGMIPSAEVQDFFMNTFDEEKKGRKFKGAKIHNNGLLFPIINGRLHLPKGFKIGTFDVTSSWKKEKSGWVQIPSGKTDLSYSQIVRAIEEIKMNFNLTDSKIAILQLCALTRSIEFPNWFSQKIPEEKQSCILQFLDYLNGLMFGIEASGLNVALATSLMTLDLIVNERIKYQEAFKANENGGLYPYACFGNNKGTYCAREKILEQRVFFNSSMKHFRENTSLSPVAVKEAILINEWLKYQDITPGIEFNIFSSDQIKLIEFAIGVLINCYFFPDISKEYHLFKQFIKIKDAESY